MKREIGSLCCEECGDEWTQRLCPACAATTNESNDDDEHDESAEPCTRHSCAHPR